VTVAKLVRLWDDERGSNAIEYGFIVGLISLAIMVGASATTGGISALFSAITTESTTLASGLAS
jgi:pilus assembly protein Flp/PilA